MVWTIYAEDNDDFYPSLSMDGAVVDRHSQDLTANKAGPISPTSAQHTTHYLNPYVEPYISVGDVPDHLKIFSLTACPLASPAFKKFKEGEYAMMNTNNHIKMPYFIFAGARGGSVRLGDTWAQLVGGAQIPVEMNIMAGELSLYLFPNYVATHYAKPEADPNDFYRVAYLNSFPLNILLQRSFFGKSLNDFRGESLGSSRSIPSAWRSW